MTAPEGRMTLVVWPTYVGLAAEGETTLPEGRRSPIHWSPQQVGTADCWAPAGYYVRRLYFYGPDERFPVCGAERVSYVQCGDGPVHLEIVNGDQLLGET